MPKNWLRDVLVMAALTFEDLMSRRATPREKSLIFNIHIPKAAGISVGALIDQNSYRRVDLDADGSFSSIRNRDAFRSPDRNEDYVLTGHYRLDHEIFRYFSGQSYVVLTMLRDPIARMVSNFNFSIVQSAAPWHDEIVSGRMKLVEHAEQFLNIFGQQYTYFDDTGHGLPSVTGTASKEHCFDNLKNNVSFYGIADRFDEFAALFGYLMQRHRILTNLRLNETPTRARGELTAEEDQRLRELLADDIWFYEQALGLYRERMSDSRLAILPRVVELQQSGAKLMNELWSITDVDHKHFSFRPG